MKSTILSVLLSVIFLNSMDAQVKLTADNEKTTLNWLGEKVTGEHTGTIILKSGWLTMENNMITGGEFEIDMSSIKDADNNARLEGHLKSDDFFGVEKYPVSKLILKGSDSFEKGSAIVRGDLTIKTSTNPVEFKASMHKQEEGTWFYANIIIDRTKYNVRYGSGSFFDNLGDKTIYDEFKLKVALFVK